MTAVAPFYYQIMAASCVLAYFAIRGVVLVLAVLIGGSGVMGRDSLQAVIFSVHFSALTEQQQLSGTGEGPDCGRQTQTPSARQPGEAQNPQAERGNPQSPGPAAGIPLLNAPPLTPPPRCRGRSPRETREAERQAARELYTNILPVLHVCSQSPDPTQLA